MSYYLQQAVNYASSITGYLPTVSINFSNKKPIEKIIKAPIVSKNIPMVSPFVRLAGLSGATAIALAAYGSHSLMKEGSSVSENNKRTFETASKYHLVHSVALLCSSQAKYPYLTGSLFSIGILLFCGSCYHIAMNDDRTLAKLTPYGGFCFIFGWLSFLL
uniref:Transmembrane protein 256 homolog n=1 Tax=Parastrongyloides trichosuri TaxID=131310 RepID=A0A0N4ZN60_PARTI